MTKRISEMSERELELHRAYMARLSEARKADPALAEAEREYQRQWRQKNLEHRRAKDREKAAKKRKADPDASRARKAAHRAKHREELARRQREWNATNPEKVLAINLAKYGLTLTEFDHMFADQAGQCATCSCFINRRTNGSQKRCHVDHCHRTGRVRGLLCTNCNTALGHARDSAETLRRMADYVTAGAA